jgi:hypothetical protein
MNNEELNNNEYCMFCDQLLHKGKDNIFDALCRGCHYDLIFFQKTNIRSPLKYQMTAMDNRNKRWKAGIFE